MNAEVNTLIDEIKEQNALYDRGEKDKAFWIAQQHRLKAIKDADPELSNRKIGELVEKSPTWVKQVMEFDQKAGSAPNWRRGSHATAAEVEKGAQQAMRDPLRRKRLIKDLTPEERVEVAVEASKEPEVAEQVVQRSKSVRKAAEDEGDRAARQRLNEARERQLQGRKATTLSQFFYRMITQMLEWINSLDAIREDLEELPADQKERLIERHRQLIKAAQENLDILEGRNIEPTTIEGKITETKAISA